MSLIPNAALPHINISTTFGATLIGSFISTALYGLTTLQTYLYYIYYPNDSSTTKTLVAVIWILDSLHSAFMAYSIYFYLVTSYFNPDLLGTGHWSLFLSIAFNTVIACIVQMFFVLRIHQLCSSKLRWWVSSVIGLTVLAHFAFGIETVVFMFLKKELSRLQEIRFIAATPFAIFAVLSDIMIAGTLCYLLHGSRSGFKRTDTIISILIIYAINRCLLTSVVAVAEVIVYCTMPLSLWFLAIDFFIGKLYANSLLATLNSRVAIRAGDKTTLNSIHLSEIEFNPSAENGTKAQADMAASLGAGSSTRRQTTLASHATDRSRTDNLGGDKGQP